jgi:hypothetical protein
MFATWSYTHIIERGPLEASTGSCYEHSIHYVCTSISQPRPHTTSLQATHQSETPEMRETGWRQARLRRRMQRHHPLRPSGSSSPVCPFASEQAASAAFHPHESSHGPDRKLRLSKSGFIIVCVHACVRMSVRGYARPWNACLAREDNDECIDWRRGCLRL